MPVTPFDPSTGKYIGMESAPGKEAKITLATINSQEDDYLKCYFNSNYQEVYVAKPRALRRSLFDGLTVDGVSYVYSNAYTRVASADGEDDETQLITPSYYDGEQIIIFHHDTGLTVTLGLIVWGDLNTAARAWAVSS